MAVLMPEGRQSFTDSAGAPLVGGKVFTYDAGTNNPRNTYTSEAGVSINTNPIILDGRGEAVIFWTGAYKVVLTDAAGATIWTQDNITSTDTLIAASSAATTLLRNQLADSTSASNGAVMVGYKGSLNYVGLTIGARLLDVGASPRSLGAVGDGVADDTAFIVSALLYSKTLDLRNRSWKITSTVALPAGCVIDLRGGAIVAACGATPVFSFTGAKEGLLIQGGGSNSTSGQVTGTASDFLFCEGSTDQPTLASQYARQIRVKDVHVTSTTITNFITFNKACRQIYIRGCMVFTPNGILFSGKNVEAMISDSIIYSATGAAGTFGIKTRSTGGTVYYNEGVSVVNCTIDNFETTFDITDIFTFSVTGGYTSAIAAGYAYLFQAPSTNQCEEIVISGGVIGGRIRFAASGAGRTYYAHIGESVFSGVPGTAIAVENNAANITVSNAKFKAGSGTAIGVVGTNNNDSIRCTNLDFDSTYQNGVVLNGATGANCVIGPVSGPTIGALVGAGRSNILYVGVPIASAGVASMNRASSAANLAAAYIVGAAISTQAVTFAAGETGDILINLPYSGANAATQNVQIGVPAGMVLQSGTGYSAANLYVGAATGLLFARVPYYCTADGTGNVTVTNQAGNTLTINNQGYCGIVRNW